MKKRILFLGMLVFASFFGVSAQELPPPPPEKNMDPRGMHGKRYRDPMEEHPEIFEDILKMMPEKEQARLTELAKTDRNAFYAEIRAFMERKRKMEWQEIHNLKKRYAEAKTDEEKKAVREELKKKVSANFDRHQEMARKSIEASERRIQMLEKNVEQAKVQLKKNTEKRDAIVDQITDNILSGKMKQGGPKTGHKGHHHEDGGNPPPPPPPPAK